MLIRFTGRGHLDDTPRDATSLYLFSLSLATEWNEFIEGTETSHPPVHMRAGLTSVINEPVQARAG